MENISGGKSNLRGILYMLIGAGSFVLNDSMMKLVMADAPPYQTLFFRGVFAFVWAIPLLTVLGHWKDLPQALNRFIFARGMLEVMAIMTFILALANAPIGHVTAIFQILPMLILVGMAVFHREKIDGLRWALVFAGFAGALFVAQPGFGSTSPFALLAFAGAFFAALRDLVGRRIPSTTPVLVSTFVTNGLVMIAAGLGGWGFETWIAPSSKHYMLLLGTGLLVTVGHMFTFLAFKHAQAQAVAPFYYSFMIWAVALGFVIFGDVPNSLATVGMLLILASGLTVVYLEGRSKKPLP
jgi:drug/metabolite transporter (DMT)-like permease